ncbi:anti-sigma factor [Corynebacterium glyciniphilum]|uniref:anti-sigma factor n=1 Tax=Corynebacterium glyciniphilum TaxID=1404244 RepID=UPI003DA15B9F
MSEERRDELLIGLALDALDSDADIREAEELVGSDPEAAARLRRYRAAAAELASAYETTPPPELKNSVMQRIGNAAVSPTPLHPHQRNYRRTAWLMTAVAAVSLAVAVPAVTVAISQHNRTEEDAGSLGAANVAAAYDEVTRLLTTPGTTVRSERTSDGRGSLALVVSDEAADDNVVIARGLPELADDRVYQLWSLDSEGSPTSAGVMDEGEDRTGFAVGVDVASAVAVTDEPTGGSDSPTTEPVVVLATER